MATVFIPTQLRDLTAGQVQILLPGKNLRQLVAGLEENFPGISGRLLDAQLNLAPSLTVCIDGQVSMRGMFAPVGPESEVHFLPALGGG